MYDRHTWLGLATTALLPRRLPRTVRIGTASGRAAGDPVGAGPTTVRGDVWTTALLAAYLSAEPRRPVGHGRTTHPREVVA
ncbi:hypothetical protein ACN2WE_37480 [Streptomyces sp. cg28]|uniref:hypothetical protein n=1 Tax=Streptomyces sp. cg28 TaxID=3403457 RepID=UPI003B20F577